MHALIQAVVNGAVFGGIYALGGVTFGLLYQVTKVFHIAFATIGMLGTMIAVSIAGDGGWAAIISGTAVGMAAVALTTVAVYLLIYRPLVRRGADTGTTFVASLGLSLVIEAMVVLTFGPENRSFNDFKLTREHEIGGYGVSALHVLVLATVVVVTGGLSLVLGRTRIGHRVRAMISNPEQAELVGIRTLLLSVGVCAVVGALSVLPFVLQGLNTSVVVSSSLPVTLFAVLAMIAGGIGSVWGTALAGMAIGIINGLAAAIVPGQWATSVVFVCALTLILIRPTGVVRTPATSR